MPKSKNKGNYIYIKIDPTKIMLLEKNAHYMKHETFKRLTSNISRDGDLEQDPFCAYHEYYTAKDSIQYFDDGKTPKLEVLSGNHRVQSAIEAGIKEINVKVYTLRLTRKERIAKQLAHNAIFGEDDPAILKELYQEMDDIALQEYSGLDDKTLEMLEKIGVESIAEANLDFQFVTLAFLPDEHESAKNCLEEIKGLVASDEIWMAHIREYDSFLDSLASVAGATSTKNTATAIMILLSIFQRHLTDLSEYWCNEKYETPNKFIPVSTIIGTDAIPAQAGAVIKKAVDKMRDEGMVTTKNLWQALEYWAADYLAQ